MATFHFHNTLLVFLGLALFGFNIDTVSSEFPIREATVRDIQIAFHQNKLTSKKLVQFYIREIERLNPVLRAVIEVNPDAVKLARKADLEREANATVSRSLLHGIPILVKDNIATKDKMNTTAGSYALLGSVVPRDAGVVVRLRKAGAIILGKASLSEWAHGRSLKAPSGWCARTGQAVNPYVKSQDPCGSSTGSAISVAANLAAISLGTETDGSILCPSSSNSVVGIKPTVGLTSRGGVIPLTPRQDSVGPICRTVSDAVYVLDAIVGYDRYDAVATREASKYIPNGGYVQFLKPDGLRGKRLGISNYLYFGFPKNSNYLKFKQPLQTLRQGGAILVDHIKIPDYETIKDSMAIGEHIAMTAELKLSLNAYLKGLITSPVRSLADIIAFNNKFSDLEKTGEYGQDDFLESEKTNGIGEVEKKALLILTVASKYGFERLMRKYKLDALVTPLSEGSRVLAIGGYPGINVPAGYNEDGTPYGICFGGLRGSEPKLIEIAYGFEQASKVRKPPSFKP
ncbi:putative amidase [Camellia lanceoleosa]|uniref:Amidase n=1 Tax=Camellia lanceoleosa TaxID=1840588 RepID=A0ACC0IRD7_9ERIC|nr:putative amidase [Camellia lanceoleosa]